MKKTAALIIVFSSVVSPAWAGLFDSYSRGKKEDVIAEMRKKLINALKA